MEQVIHPKFVVNARGQPTDVILSWEEYLDISEMLGLDLDDQTKTYLRVKPVEIEKQEILKPTLA